MEETSAAGMGGLLPDNTLPSSKHGVANRGPDGRAAASWEPNTGRSSERGDTRGLLRQLPAYELLV